MCLAGCDFQIVGGGIMKRDDVLAILKEFKRDRAEEYGILEIGVFGLVARDEAKEEIEKRVKRRVEIIPVREKMNPFLREHIEREGRYV